MDLRTVSINCHGLKTSTGDIYDLCSKYDILFLQETWLLKSELHMLSTLHPDFQSMGISAINEENGILCGRPFGGLAILWRKELEHIKVHDYNDPRLLGLEVHSNHGKLMFINVYMPYQCADNSDLYLHYLGKLAALVHESDTSKIALLGDFNASTNTAFGRELAEMCKTNNLVLSDIDLLGSNTYTFVSDAHHTVSWLDHFVSSADMHHIIKHISVLDKWPTSDHLPLATVLNVCASNASEGDVKDDVRVHKNGFKWYKADDVSISQYEQMTKSYISSINLPVEALSCQDIHCKCDKHRQAIDKLYQDICNTLHECSKACIESVSSTSNNHVTPGWNDYIKDLHHEARSAYVMWRDLGKPRTGPISELMRRSRLIFKYALRQCKRNEQTLRADAMAKDFECKDVKSFWSKVAKMQNNNLPPPSVVGDCHGEKAIAEMWKSHYECIMNSVKTEKHKPSVLASIEGICSNDKICIMPQQVLSALKKAKKGKSPGLDGLSSEHFIFADKNICALLSLLYSCMLMHGYLPKEFMLSAILPIIKNKTGDTSDKGNYRPIAKVTSCSKLFESILLDIVDDYLSTTDNQFGFKSNHSTDLCLFTLKNVIEYYKNLGSPVFACFLDASKAFDRVNHWSLFQKLNDKHVPIVIIRILFYWYREQLVCIKWCNTTSECFKVTNGVRQGSVLSPKIFAIYVDQLSELLINCKAGCFIDNVCFNHLFYADDLCLLAPSAIALQKLINMCNEYGIDNDIMYNPLKSIGVIFKPNRYRLRCPTVHLGGEVIDYKEWVKYLGVIVSADCNDNEEMLKQVRGIYAKCNTILRKFKFCSQPVKLRLFQAYCTNFYCAHLWSSYNGQVFNKLKVAYNNAFRYLLHYDKCCSASHMFVTNNTLCLEGILRKSIYDFKERISCSANVLIITLVSNSTLQNSAMCKKWFHSLYV